MHLNVPKYETTFLIPFKSGNRLLYSSLIELLELNKISYKLSYDTNEFEKDCQLFVRNPIERFFSSYNWFLRMDDAHDLSGKREWTVNEKKNFEKIAEVFHECEINSPSTFISNYIQFINSTDDFHYLPQTSFFITKSDDKGVRANVNFNFRKEYDKFFTGNYRINRIEEIDELIDVNNQILRLSKFNVDFKNKPLPNQELKEFSFLRNFPKEFNYQFMMIYVYFKSYYGKFHHSADHSWYYEQITLQEYQHINELFKKEMLFFGYSDDVDVSEKKFKNILD